ncbi:MAG: TrbI/VirB10 family protein, partial [Candidatus Acidiferrales bacterium]
EGPVPPPGGVIGASSSEPPSQPDPVKEDKKKREYLSLFAPNVAFSYRKGTEPEQLTGYHSSSTTSADPRAEAPLAPSELESQLRQAESQVLAGHYPSPGPVAAPVARDEAESAQNAKSINPNVATPGEFNSSTGSRYLVFEGTILETLLINRLNGTLSGPVDCLLTTDLYSRDRQHLLMPAGTRILGEAKKVEAFGQQRLAVFFHRVIMPDGFSLNLDQFKGLNQIGETALRDKVNNHYLQIFGASLAVGILGGIAEAGTGNAFSNSPLDQARAGFGANLANSSMQILDRFLNILPTVTIREGNRVKIYLAGDLLLPDYAQHTMRADL